MNETLLILAALCSPFSGREQIDCKRELRSCARKLDEKDKKYFSDSTPIACKGRKMYAFIDRGNRQDNAFNSVTVTSIPLSPEFGNWCAKRTRFNPGVNRYIESCAIKKGYY